MRLEAVRALTSDEADILATVAKSDKDPGVRRVAIEKLERVELLAELAESEHDRGNRDLAGTRAAELWVSSACQGDDAELAANALAGLVKLGDDRSLVAVATRAADHALRARAADAIREARALVELAKATTSPEVRQAALARLDDADALRGLAIDTSVKELGLAALDKLTAEDVLEQVAQKAKAKAVRQRARKRLDEFAAAREAARPKEDDALRRRKAEKAQVLRAVEALAETFDFDKAGPEMATAEDTWRELGDTNEPALEERFARAVTRFHSRQEVAARAVHEPHRELDQRREPAVPAPRRERARDPDDVDIINPVHGDVLARKPAPPEDDAARAAREKEAAERRAARDAARAEADAARAQEEAEREAKKKEYGERAGQLAKSLAALIDDMEAVAGEAGGDPKAIDRLLGQGATAFAQLGKVAAAERDALETRYVAARGKLVVRTQELREGEDWKRWANVPRAEALVAAAKELAEREEAPTIQLLKVVQQAWKELGPMPSKKSKELWDTFKAHCDAAFARIRSTRAAEDEKLAGNVDAKRELVAAAQALADSTDFEATALAMKELQKRWKDSGPTPRKIGDELWREFRGACDRFFERRKPTVEAALRGEQDNLAAKHQLIAAAETVVAKAPGEAGWGKAIGQIKDLQREWQAIGRVPRAEVEPLWQRFRGACDALFAKRDAARDAEADAQRAELEAVRADIEAVMAGGADVAPRALAVRAKLAELAERDLAPSAELRGLYDQMVRQVMTAHGDALRGTDLDPVAMASARAKLIERVERLLPQAAPTVSLDGAAPADLAQRLKQAMAGNALWKGDGRDPIEVIDEVRGRWATVGPIVGADAEAAAARFEELCVQVRTAHGAAGDDGARADRAPQGERGERGGDRGGKRRDRRDRRRDEGAQQVASELTAAPPTAEVVVPRAVAPTPVAPTPIVAPIAAAAVAPIAVDPPVEAAPTRARTSTLPPGVTEELDDEWDAPAAAPVVAAPVVAAPVVAAPVVAAPVVAAPVVAAPVVAAPVVAAPVAEVAPETAAADTSSTAPVSETVPLEVVDEGWD
ncbi:MAG: DUF349 domain-containing protein [Myxococcales bacterium]|nr:DUF349 domain-containing protein [Myxococcales bacterium]